MRHPAAIAILALAVLCAPALRAQDTSAQEGRKARLEKEIKILEQQLKDNSSKSSSALTKLNLTRQKVNARKALLNESDREIKALGDSVIKYQREYNRVKARLDTMTLYYNKLVKSAYKNRDARVWYMYLLGSKNIAQAGRRYNYLRSLSGTMSTQATKIKETQTELAARLEKVKETRAAAQKLRNERKLELDRLQGEEKENNKLVATLNKEKTRYQKELSSKRSQVDALNKEIQKIIAQNKKAYHDYFVEARYEAGIALYGTEIKSIRAGGVNLKDAYCQVKNGEIIAVGIHISPYEHGSFYNKDPLRDRKLLMHKKEILKLGGQLTQKGLTLIPLSLYFSGQRVKVEVGLCRGKKEYDKRDTIAKAESDREIERNLKTRTNRNVDQD